MDDVENSPSSPKSETMETKPDDPPPIPKWQVVENVVAAFERLRAETPDTVVRQKAHVPRTYNPAKTREIDVVVEIPHEGGARTVGIDVKNEKRPFSLEKMGTLFDKRRKVKLDEYHVVSTSGFTEDVYEEAELDGVKIKTLEEFNMSPFWASKPGMLLIEHQPELIHTELKYNPHVLPSVQEKFCRARANKIGFNEAIFQDSVGSIGLLKAVELIGVNALGRFTDQLSPQSIFWLNIDMSEQKHARIVFGGEQIPIPDSILAFFRYHRFRRTLPEHRFRLDGIEASTTDFRIFGEHRQMTLASVPRSDGAMQIKLAMGPARPPTGRR